MDKKTKKQAEGYLKKLFTGRIARGNYFVGYLIVSFGSPILIAVAGFPLTAFGLGLSGLVAFLVWTVGTVFGLSLAVRRFQDIGRKPIELLWFLVPIVNLYFVFLIFFKVGDKGKNEFGPAPQKKIDFKEIFKLDD